MGSFPRAAAPASTRKEAQVEVRFPVLLQRLNGDAAHQSVVGRMGDDIHLEQVKQAMEAFRAEALEDGVAVALTAHATFAKEINIYREILQYD
jgi:hypothetical protein